jgi:hypothetical protein
MSLHLTVMTTIDCGLSAQLWGCCWRLAQSQQLRHVACLAIARLLLFAVLSDMYNKTLKFQGPFNL